MRTSTYFSPIDLGRYIHDDEGPKRIFGIRDSWLPLHRILIAASIILVLSGVDDTNATVVGADVVFGKTASSSDLRFPSRPCYWRSGSSNWISRFRKHPAARSGVHYGVPLRTASLLSSNNAASPKGEGKFDESYFDCRRKGIEGEVMQNVKGETLIELTNRKMSLETWCVRIGFRVTMAWSCVSFGTNGLNSTNDPPMKGLYKQDRMILTLRRGTSDDIPWRRPGEVPVLPQRTMFGDNFREADLFDQLIETLGEYTRVAVTT